jgi:hypothetical protein
MTSEQLKLSIKSCGSPANFYLAQLSISKWSYIAARVHDVLAYYENYALEEKNRDDVEKLRH